MNGIKYIQEELDYMKKHYPHIRTDIIANKLNRSMRSVYSKAKNMDLKKSAEFLASPESGIFVKGSTAGKEFRYPKGHVPANKSKKMSSELYEKCKPTMFKKGNLPGNTLKDGEITIRNNKLGTQYYHIRLSLGKWEYLHRVLWEKENEPIPKGFNVAFKDNNTANCKIENLELISNAELMQRNSIQNYPKDLQRLIQVKGALKRQINKIIENE